MLYLFITHYMFVNSNHIKWLCNSMSNYIFSIGELALLIFFVILGLVSLIVFVVESDKVQRGN